MENLDFIGNELNLPADKSEKEITILPSQPYRGIKYFRYADRNIFSAREWEKEQLLNLVSLYRGNLVYGQSGIGKSSLINAGLVPELEQYNFQAEIIRISPNREETFVIYKILKADEENVYLNSLFIESNNSNPQVSISFENFKKIILSQKYLKNEGEVNDRRPIPVLIFDQFEELITLFEEVKSSALSDKELTFSERRDFQLEIIDFFKECYYDSELRIKILFIFREDYLAKFSSLIRAIPDLRDHSLRIKAISEEDIQEIIQCPFSKEASKTTYPNALTETQVLLLTEELKKYFGVNDAVLTDIQIACQYIFETPVDKRDALLINSDGVLKYPIDTIIRKFYNNLLENLPQADKSVSADILSLLVLNERTRNILHQDAIAQNLKGKYSNDAVYRVLQKLDNETRLIRSEIRPGGVYYEINSETLIPFINNLKQEKERRKKIIRQLSFIIPILFVVILAIILIQKFYIEHLHNKQSPYLLASGYIQSQNPTLSYIIAREASKINNSNSDLNNFLGSYKNNVNQYYITDIIKCPQNILSAFFQGDDTIETISENSINYFNRSGFLVNQKKIHDILYADTKLAYLIDKKNSNIDYTIDTNELRNLDGQVISTFISKKQNPRVFAIAQGGKSFLIDNFIYKSGIDTPIAHLMIPDVCKDLMAAIYTSDGTHIIAGFWSGHIIVYDSVGRMVKAFQGGYYNSVITSLAATNDSKYLIVGGRSNNLRFFELGNINLPGKDIIEGNEIVKSANANQMYLGNDESGGQINAVIISPDSKNFLSLSQEKKGAIWNFQGEELASLNGHKESIIGGDYYKNGNQILTWSSSGNIYIWNKKPIADLYFQGKLATFSPFDYRIIGLDNYTFDEIYNDTTTVDKLFKATLNYNASIPVFNNKPDDKSYKNVISISLRELSTMYSSLLQPGHFNLLSKLNKGLLYNTYGTFRHDSIILTQGKYQNDPAKFSAYADQIFWKSKELMIDTADIKTAINYASTYDVLAQKFGDSLFNYNHKKAVYYLEQGIDLLTTFKKKYSGDIQLDDQLAGLYASLSWNSLFEKKYSEAHDAADRAIRYNKEYDWANTNIALSYLLSKNFKEAKSFYIKYKDSSTTRTHQPLKEAFLQDFNDLEKQGVITPDNPDVYNEEQKIKKLLTDR